MWTARTEELADGSLLRIAIDFDHEGKNTLEPDLVDFGGLTGFFHEYVVGLCPN